MKKKFSGKYNMCLEKVRINCLCTEGRKIVYLVSQSADPNPFRGTALNDMFLGTAKSKSISKSTCSRSSSVWNVLAYKKKKGKKEKKKTLI